MVFGYLMKLCGDRELAEDLLQETFYQAVRCSGKYDGSCGISTWLCSIAGNLWKRELRKRGKAASISLEETTEAGNAAEHRENRGMSAEETYFRKEQAMDVMKQIHSLPEHEKEVLLLRGMGGLSFREIGEVMEKSENWARVTFFRAKKKIREESI